MSSVSIDETALPVAEPAVPEPWETVDEEQQAASFGMWLFLATEMLFFGGLFLCYTVYRFMHTEGFLAGARETDLELGTINTVILLTSSLTMVMAVQGGRAGLRGLVWKCLAATALLGAAFLAVKGYEWSEDLSRNLFPGAQFAIAERGAPMFWALYWVMTALHGIHLTIGVVIVARLAWLMRGLTSLKIPDLVTVGLYWHFVDTIWIFLYPLLYLSGRAS